MPASNDHFILVGHEVVPEPDFMKWINWFETADRRVLRDELPDGTVVSTVFLGLNHGWKGELRIFETMIFPTDQYDYQTRCATWDQAVEMHMKALQYLREGVSSE